jgi:hypothetical protein
MNNMVHIVRVIDLDHRGGPTAVDLWQCLTCKDVVKVELRERAVCNKCM